MANKIDQVFNRLRTSRRKALIGYLTAGYPSKAAFLRLVPLLEEAGLDLLEIGVPFSDPIADGPVIQHSSQVALNHGVSLDWSLKAVKQLRGRCIRLPVILMSYCNPIHSMGVDAFFRSAHRSGVDGLIVPDLIAEEAREYERSAKKHRVALIYLVAPTTSAARMRMIARKTRGFLYAVSLTGVTGVRRSLPKHVKGFLRRVKHVSARPVAVGFGLSTPQQVREISRHADGVIIGSALIRQINRSHGASFTAARRFVQSLARALNARKEVSHAS